MNKKSPILLYGRSTLNIILSLATVLLIVGSTLFSHGVCKVVLPLGFFLLYIGTTIGILLSKKGAKEILVEREEDRVQKVNKIITQYREMRDRISFLRIGDDDIRKAIEYFLLVSGNYFNKCRECISYSPEANRKVEEILELCQIYLEEYDELLTEEKYDANDKDQFNQYKERIIKAIREAAEVIKVKIKNDFSGLTREEKLEIIEQMNAE